MEVEETEVIELDSRRFIQLETYRQWPNVGVLWSVRQRSGESDFPLQRGSLEQRPSGGQTADDVWSVLRESALVAAQEAATSSVSPPGGKRRPSFLDRLLHRS